VPDRDGTSLMDIDIIYMAGLFDGEGCISIGKRSTKNGNFLNLRLSLAMTVGEPIDLFFSRFGGSKSLRKSRGSFYAPVYFWEISALKAQVALETLLPYLRVKQKEALIALEFRKVLPPIGNKNILVQVWEDLFDIKDQLSKEKFKNNPERLQTRLQKDNLDRINMRLFFESKNTYSRWINRERV
jgi:hypothetical protein